MVGLAAILVGVAVGACDGGVMWRWPLWCGCGRGGAREGGRERERIMSTTMGDGGGGSGGGGGLLETKGKEGRVGARAWRIDGIRPACTTDTER